MRERTMTVKSLLAASLLLAAAHAHGATTITIVNRNAPGVGFNDATPAAPVGGNSGTTLGQQRLIAFQYAASVWGAALDSSVPIRVAASFEPLACTANSATLGSAGASDIFADFPNAPRAATWYPAALASKLAGIDQVVDDAPHIVARFNSRLGLFEDCMPKDGFYLGLDGQAGIRIDLVTVLLHEMAHGLGFQTFTSDQSGAQVSNLPSVWDHYLIDNRAGGKTWAAMTDAERSASAIGGTILSWNGAGVTGAVPQVLSPVSQLLISGAAAGKAAGSMQVGDAGFGPPLGARAVVGAVAMAGQPQACSALSEAAAAAIQGKVALVDRGTCPFVDKAKNVQAAGAIAMIVADNAPGDVTDLGGAEPGITIPSVRVSQQSGVLLKEALKTPGDVTATLGIDASRLAGTDGAGRMRMYTPTEYAPGSTVSHFTTDAKRNVLMEPSISADLGHTVAAPRDLTHALLKDIGW
jgi:hypothetical protein